MGEAQAFLRLKRGRIENVLNNIIYFYVSQCATLKEAFTGTYDGVLPRTR